MAHFLLGVLVGGVLAWVFGLCRPHNFTPSWKLDHIISLLERLERTLTTEILTMAADLTRLTASVQANTDAEDSAIALLGQLAELVRASATDPAAVTALADQLDAKKDALAAAILANTPAAPEAPPAEPTA